MDAKRLDHGLTASRLSDLLPQPEWPVHPVCACGSGQGRICGDQHEPAGFLAVTDDKVGSLYGVSLTEVADNDANAFGKRSNDGAHIFNTARIGQKKPARQVRPCQSACLPRGISELAGDGRGVFHPIMPSTATDHDIADSRAQILSELSDACDHAVELIAVSKKQPDERLQAALDAGQRVFGENRVQEAQDHWQARRDIEGLCLHLIGPLQSNKSEDAVALFDVIQTVDRKKIVRTLSEAAEKLGRYPDLLIQVNTGEEDQKSGVMPDELDDLISYTRDTYPGELKGLMAIPPVDEPAGPHFALLKKLADRARLPWVSMGMSADYALGASLGATHVRVGSAFFGERETA